MGSWASAIPHRGCAAIILLLACGFSLHGQLQLSTMRGTATDSTGAIVLGVRVTVTDVKTGVKTRTVVTDANGNYEVPDVIPGVYRVMAEMQGFKTFVADNIVVEGSQIRRVDVRMELGQLSEQITVEGGAAVITTDSAQITAGFKRIFYDESPLRIGSMSPGAVLSILPGVESQGSTWSLNINGQPPAQVALGQDGVTIDGTVSITGNMDHSEITVTGVNNTADQARVANYNMVSKRGDNTFHGEAYGYLENSALNARRFFDPTRTPWKTYMIEFELTGPIIRNKTFFYVGYVYRKVPSNFFYLRSVPSASQRAGDFSLVPQVVRDPLNNQPFPDRIVPASRFNPTALKIQQDFIPEANMGAPDSLVNNFGFRHPFPNDLYEGRYPQLRFDHNFSEKNSIFGRWVRRRTPYVLAGNFPQLVRTRVRSHTHSVISDTHVFSPSLVHSFRVGIVTDYIEDGMEKEGFVPLKADDVIQRMGIQGVNQPGLTGIQGSPTVSITGFTGLSLASGGVGSNDRRYSYADSLTWAVGRHVMKFGGELKTAMEFLGSVPAETFGSFTFNGRLSNVPYADFLLGLPYSSSRVNPLLDRKRRAREFGIYAMDTFKVTNRLSLDYGLRWDYFAAARYDDGLQYVWDQSTGSVIVPDLKAVSPLYPASITVTAGNVVPSPDKRNLRPRIGFAFRLRDTTVLRGGYGVFTEQIGSFARLQGGGPFQISETYNNVIEGGKPLFAFPNPYPVSLASAVIPSQSVVGFPMQTDNGSVHQFNLTAEQQVGDLGFRLSYIGSRGRGLNYNLSINKPRPSLIPFTQTRRPYVQFIGVTMAQNDGRSNYDSLQFEVSRKMGSLIQFNAHYTMQSHLSDYQNLENPYDHKFWNRETFSARHRSVISATIELPVGKGRRFLADAPGAVNHVLGGWRINTTSNFSSGQFFSPGFSGSDPSNTNTSGGLPDRICDGNLPRGERTIERWFDPKCFAAPPPGRFGNSGTNVLKRPGLNLHHLSATKEFQLNERFRLEFVHAISNLFNHPTFAPPISNISVAGTGRITGILMGSDVSVEKTRAREMAMTLRLRW